MSDMEAEVLERMEHQHEDMLAILRTLGATSK